MARKATSRDPQEWARATEAARDQRKAAAASVAATLADQAYDTIVECDEMGGRALFAARVQDIAGAVRRNDAEVLRSALMSAVGALGAWLAALDFRRPPDVEPKPRSSDEVMV